MIKNKPLFLISYPEITDAAVNLALEEYCFRNLGAGNDYLILYINEASVVIGAHQNPWEEISTEAIANNEIAVLRRISGGGAVFHDQGNINLCFLTDYNTKIFGDFAFFTQPIIKSLNRLGVKARHAHQNTIEIDGKKISGNAQFTNTKRMFSHGTLLYNSDLNLLAHALDSHFKPIDSKSVASVRRQVGNIIDFLERPMALDSFVSGLLQGISKEYRVMKKQELSDAMWADIHQLADEKYRSREWIYGHTPPFSVMENCVYGAKNYPLRVSVKKGLIDHLESADREINHVIGPKLSRQWIGKPYQPNSLGRLKY